MFDQTVMITYDNLVVALKPQESCNSLGNEL